jgi:hypothetical protein
MRARRLLLALTITAALLALAPPASAAAPFTAGTGSGQDVAVGSDGTGHVVWVTNEADDRIGYCRVPVGGTACDSESTFLDFPGAASASPSPHAQVFTPAAGKVVIVASCHTCPDLPTRTFRFTSTNNGVDFGAATQVGNLALNGQGDYIDPTNVALSVGASLFQAQVTPATTTQVPLGQSPTYVYDASVAVHPGGTRAVYAVNDLHHVGFRVFSDPATPGITASELNNAANWSASIVPLSGAEADNGETHVDTGPGGVYLTYRSAEPTDSRVGLRKFDTGTGSFGSPTYIEGPDPIESNGIGELFHSQDPSGRLHVVWRSLYDGNRLRYTRSDDGGATFTAVANLATRETFTAPKVEAGPGGTGFATWRDGSTIRVVPIDPQPEPAAPGGPGAPGDGGGPDTTPPATGGLTIGDPTLTPGQRTTFTFDTSENGVATLTVQKQVRGLKVRVRGKRRCVPQTRKRLRALRRQAGSRAAYRRLLRKRRCTAYKRIGSITQRVTAGSNTIYWGGRIAGRRLRPGRYRAQLVVRDLAGNVSRVERLRFRVLRRRR